MNYFVEKNKLKAVLIPNGFKFSALLKLKHVRPYLRYMNELKNKLALHKEKAPEGRNLLEGYFSIGDN